jgi:hypothetical protein
MAKVIPLKKKTMTLNELQLRTLDAIRLTKFQFKRQAYQEGMTDEEFIDQVLEPLATDIYQDRQMVKILKKQQRQAKEDGK